MQGKRNLERYLLIERKTVFHAFPDAIGVPLVEQPDGSGVRRTPPKLMAYQLPAVSPGGIWLPLKNPKQRDARTGK